MLEPEELRPTFRDFVILAVFGFVLFGSALLTVRPMLDWELSVAVGARTMDRPPLPFWVSQMLPGTMIDRLGCAGSAVLVVLLTAWMAGRFFERRTGLMSGYLLATTWRFFIAGSHVSESVYLALLVTLTMFVFSRSEWFNDQRSYATRTNPFGTRAWGIVGLFTLIGLANYAQAILIGPIIVVTSLVAFLTWNLDARRFLRYAWVWGWLSAIGVGIVWPAVSILREPGVVTTWHAQLFGANRSPVWLYAWAFVVSTLPWMPLLIAGIRETWLRAKIPGTPARLILCWAIVPLLALTLLSTKHAAYLVPLLPAWAIIFAFGLQRVWTLVKARFPDASGAVAFRNLVILVAAVEITLQFFIR